MPYGDPLPDNPDVATIHYVAETRQPRVAGLSRDPITQRPTVTINVPVMRDSQLVYVLSLDIVSTLPRVLAALDLPEDWVASIFDRQGAMIARSRDADRYVGQPAFAATSCAHLRSEDEGWVPGMSREGVPLFTAFVHTQLGDWTISAGIPRVVLLARARQTTWLLLLLGGATVVAGDHFGGDDWTAHRRAGHRIGADRRSRRPRRAGHSRRDRSDRGKRCRAVLVRGRRAAAPGRRSNGRAATAALSQSEQMYRALAEDLARVDRERTALLNRVVVAQENERKRIARELHDSLAQYLTALRLKLNTLRPIRRDPRRPRGA